MTLSSGPIYSLYLGDLDHNPPASSTQSLTRGGSSNMRSRPLCLGLWDEGLWADCPTISQHSQAPALTQTQLAERSARTERYSAGLEEREQSEFPVPSPREGHPDMSPLFFLWLARLDRALSPWQPQAPQCLPVASREVLGFKTTSL